jgi:type I restriction-modification system DNA methylase subunit
MGEILKRHGVKSTQEVSIESEKFPDLLAEIDGHRFLVEVKIDSESKLLEDIASAYVKGMKINAQGIVSALFPSSVREIHPDILDSIAPRLEIAKVVVALPWVADSWKKIRLEDFALKLEESYKVYTATRYPSIGYDVIVSAAREAVVEIASAIRHNLVSQYMNDAMAIVGRFDIYRAELADLGVKEDEIKAWIADIAAYLTANQLLFYHVLSQKTGAYSPLPPVNPFLPNNDLIDKLRELFSKAAKDYEPVFGPDLLTIIARAGELHSLRAISRYITALKALKPEHIKGELLGRLYQESIPPEARKNLGAFFTKPKAAALLSTLAIDTTDEKVLDPACGSGTLLTEAYKRKKKLAPDTLSEESLHKELLSKIYGIDIMHFAYHMTSINLLAQNLTVPADLKNIRAGDGLEPMVLSVACKDDDPPMMRLIDWVESVRPQRLPHENFDIVIMNPPFTRRERLSEVGEIDRLEKLFHDAFDGEVIRGKVGYWAYFMAAADGMLKPNGKLAMVTPEEFFAGGSAESLRRFLFFNETFKEGKYRQLKKPLRIYAIDCVVRSGKEVAFSETALYRDYLVVFKKTKAKVEKPITFVILKKPLDEITEEKTATEIREFASSLLDKISTENFEAMKIHNVNSFLRKHAGNLKPLVGFNTTKAQELFLELIEVLWKHPTLGELDEKEQLKIRVYNPGQYTAKGVEDEARKLFVKRYKGRGKALFEYVCQNKKMLKLSPIGVEGLLEVSLSDVIPALRTYAGVRKMDISGVEEYALINPKNITLKIRKAKGMASMTKYCSAADDIRAAHKNLAGDVLLVRRAQMPSPGLYWLAYYTSNKALGTTSALLNLRIGDTFASKMLTLYLNSSVALLQLIGFVVETRGAWITLHGDQVWKHIHVPSLKGISKKLRNDVLRIFDKVAKMDAENLFDRLKNMSPIQKEIDEVSIELLGMSGWKDRLGDIHIAIRDELQAMLEILDRSRKPAKKTKKIMKEETSKGRQLVLDNY